MIQFKLLTFAYLAILLSISLVTARLNQTSPYLLQQSFTFFDDRPEGCPPCFNCNLEDFQCQQFANCSQANGKCSCPPGFGGDACSDPLCGSLPKGKERAPRGKDQKSCVCDEGWEGINCNVCKTNDGCNALMPDQKGGVCYRQGEVVHENYQVCDITNVKIIDALDPRKPQATFSCNKERQSCNFQFWIEELESFYCTLDSCSAHSELEPNRNTTKYSCETIKCRCVPGRPLCGEENTIDISAFLSEEIKGPASFTSISTEGGSPEDGSQFKEPNMDDLISSVFGDKSITLSCSAGECLYETEVPGYEKPIKKINTPLIAGVIAGCAIFVVLVILLIWFLSRRQASKKYGIISLEDDEDANTKLMADHRPAALHFENVSYDLGGRKILSGVQGAVRPGELLAIMGASGAGKTTLLDILARKNKIGFSHGDSFVNGELIPDNEFRNVIGFVDQEDTLLPTLTVHETILDSAMLRLPKDMTFLAKEQKVEDVEKQLGIFQIRDQIIGSEEANGRGISGGEKRRVGIACELVTSPSILFLDEPTSGLDAYNAFNVVECLVNLVKTYNRTVVFTIHQPRSNIVALFDQLILLAQGHVVYSGPFSSCQNYFDSIGYSCPPGFNIADYLVDLTMHVGMARSPMDDILEASQQESQTRSSSIMAIKSIGSKTNLSSSHTQQNSLDYSNQRQRDKNNAITVKQQEQLFNRRIRSGRSGTETPTSQNGEDEALLADDNSKSSQSAWLKLSRQSGQPPPQILEDAHLLPPELQATGTDLDNIIFNYANSDVAASLQDDIKATVEAANTANNHPTTTSPSQTNGHPQPPTPNTNPLRTLPKLSGYRKVGLPGQFRILSLRTWRNLYRNPFLMLTHYAIAILVAVLIGFLFYGLTDDIAGFQNRLGLFFFILALFGFSTLTSLSVFASERLLFTRERAKGYYHPISYFLSKVLFDIVPLRLIPPLILGVIVYPMTGLTPAWSQFFRFMAFLILFNFAASSACLCIGILFKNPGLANLIGSLVMLFSLLFAGFLLNHQTIPKSALWLQTLSIFHYGFEGLLINDVKYLSLTDHKYGLDIEVPGSAILSSFGFDVQAIERDFLGLGIYTAVFLVVSYIALHVLLVERR